MNDISNNLTTNSLHFANDTLIYQPVETLSDGQALQSDLTELGRWSKANSMELKATITKVLHMSRSKKPGSVSGYVLYDSPLSHTTKYI